MLKPSKNNFRTYAFTILIILSLIDLVQSQEKNITFDIQKNPTNTDYWWLENNNFGREISEFSFQSSFKFKQSRNTYIINLFSDLENNSLEKIYFNESFIKRDLSNNTFLRFGRYYRNFSTYLNDELTSGSLLISHNAQAMPKIGLITSYVIKKNNNISFDFGIAHGMFNKNEIYKREPLLHEKFLYINIKNKDYIASIGFVHEAMWGGHIDSDHKFSGNQPSSFSDFLKVLISEDGPMDFPHANALGNHLGIWDFSFQKKNKDKILKLYYQHLFEDTSGLRFQNKTDGLWGIELTRYFFDTTILFEYLNTTNQSIDPPYVREQYYNHGLYASGWSYKDRTLGNPFIDHLNAIDTALLHLGIKGNLLNNYIYKIKLSKRINIHDNIKYKIELSKIVNDKNQISIFMVNNDNSNGLGISIHKNL
jgi:hypothetical protein